jgi:hypothetical protein
MEFNSKRAKVEDAPNSRHHGRSPAILNGIDLHRLLRALDNEEDGVSSAFLKGKQNGIFNKLISHL